MSLNRGVFHPEWVYHHRPTVDSAGLGRVRIERVNAAVDPEYDFDTGTYPGDSMIVLFVGQARIQKVAFPTTRDFVQDVAKFQRMRVQISFTGNELAGQASVPFELHVNDRVTVLANDSDPVAVGEAYYVHGTGSSSNAWNRTLTVQNNMKQDSY